MGRYSDTSNTIEKATNLLLGICDRKKVVSEEELLSGIYTILAEIALSLAVIADKGGENGTDM